MVDEDSILAKIIDKTTDDYFDSKIDHIEINLVDEDGNTVAYDNIFPKESDYDDLLWRLRDRPSRVMDSQISDKLLDEYDKHPEDFNGYYSQVTGRKVIIDYDNE